MRKLADLFDPRSRRVTAALWQDAAGERWFSRVDDATKCPAAADWFPLTARTHRGWEIRMVVTCTRRLRA